MVRSAARERNALDGSPKEAKQMVVEELVAVIGVEFPYY
jgi:hypothetical protein